MTSVMPFFPAFGMKLLNRITRLNIGVPDKERGWFAEGGHDGDRDTDRNERPGDGLPPVRFVFRLSLELAGRVGIPPAVGHPLHIHDKERTFA